MPNSSATSLSGESDDDTSEVRGERYPQGLAPGYAELGAAAGAFQPQCPDGILPVSVVLSHHP
jgi:hypothetical protein